MPDDEGLRKLGRYVLLELLGRGGMGEVYAAFDPTLDRKVALKLLFPALEQTSRDQLLGEARALARLNHPNVVAVHEVGEEDGRAWLALEYADGETLERWMKQKPRTWRELVEVFLEAGRGLHAAHLAGLVHRDFKPTNVVLRQDGRVQLLDFGIARNTSVRPPANAAAAMTTVAGTPGFMSPEQLMGQRLDARSDQFSFCVALYEALFGVLPFGDACDEAQLVRIQKQQLAPPATKVDLPRALLPILKRGLSANPEQRFASMGELMRKLRLQLPADRRMLALVAGLAVIASASVGAAVLKPRPTALNCAPKQAEIAAQWTQGQRLKAAERLGADLDGELAQMDAWLESLSTTAQRVCAGYAANLPGEQLLRQQQCLTDRQREFLLAANAVTEGRTEGRQLLDEAAPPEACLSTEVASAFDEYQRLAPARHAVDEANRAYVEGAWLEALSLAGTAGRTAKALGSAELRSSALRLEGLSRERLGDLALAEATLHFAARAAESNDEARAAAWVSLARVVGVRGGRMGDGLLWAEYAADLTARFPQRKELSATLQLVKFRLGPDADAGPQLDLLSTLLGPSHPLHPVVLAERARRGGSFDDAFAALGQAREPVVPALLGVADALEGLKGRSSEAQRLLELGEIRLASRPRAALVRLHLARLAREAGAVDAARLVATKVLVQAETARDHAIGARAQAEVDAAQAKPEAAAKKKR